MVPKIEQAKQVRASMALQTQEVPSDRTLSREGVFIVFPFGLFVSAGQLSIHNTFSFTKRRSGKLLIFYNHNIYSVYFSRQEIQVNQY